MKFFIDTADLGEIEEANAMGVLDGVTTNPSLVKMAGGADFQAHIRTICEMVDGDVSAEVVSVDFDGIMAEAHELAGIHEACEARLRELPPGWLPGHGLLVRPRECL